MKAFRAFVAVAALAAAMATTPALAAGPVWLVQKDGVTPVDPSNPAAVTCVSGCSASSAPNIGATGSAVPTSANLIGGNNGGNLTALSVDASGRISILGIANTIIANVGTFTDGSSNLTTGVQVGGYDGSVFRRIATDSAGNQKVIGTPAASTQTGATITTHGTFQSVLASSATRKSCLFQNTSTDKMYVFFGATGSATTSNSLQLSAGATVSCSGGLTVANDNIAVTSAVLDGATYVVVSQ